MSKRLKNNRLISILLLVVFTSLALAYASVPLYSIFCKVTGYNGTTRRAWFVHKNNHSIHKEITVRFNADKESKLLWLFEPQQTSIKVKTGESSLIFYRAENLTDTTQKGMAVYNVTPYKAGKYFNKIACFCFSVQTLSPHQKTIMPVSFYIDSAIVNDPETRDIDTITLSYTFFSSK